MSVTSTGTEQRSAGTSAPLRWRWNEFRMQPAGLQSDPSPALHIPTHRTARSTRAVQILFWISIVLWGSSKLWVTYTRFYNADEFDNVHQGWLIHHGAVQFRDFNSNHPPYAFWLLSLLNYFSNDSVTLLQLARTLALASAVACCYLTGRIATHVFGPLAAQVTVCLYALNSTLWEWSTTVRTDGLALPLWLGAVCLAVAPPAKFPKRRLLLIGLLLGTAFWSNQKVIFHSVPVGVLILLGGPDRQWRARDIWIALAGATLPLLPVLAYCLATHSLWHMVEYNFLDAARALGEDPYAHTRLYTLIDVLRRDPALALLFLFSVWQFARSWQCRSRREVFLVGLTAAMLVSFWLQPSTFHYYFLGVLPPLVVMVGGMIARAEWFAILQRHNSLFLSGVIVFAAFPVARMAKFATPTNEDQHRVLQVAEQLTAPGDTVFDGAGTLVNRPDAYPFHWVLWWREIERMEQGKLPPLIPALKAHRCQLFLDTYRTAWIPKPELEQLRSHFVSLWGPIRVPGYTSGDHLVGRQVVEFELWFDGIYQTDAENLCVDGKPFDKPSFLSAGQHRLFVAGEPQQVTLMLQKHATANLPLDPPQPSRFLGRYWFKY